MGGFRADSKKAALSCYLSGHASESINGENVTTTVNVTAINQPVRITVPPASQTSAPPGR
jgi:hypothetical protein